MANIKFEQKYYLINERNYHEFDEGDVIVFTDQDGTIIASAEVYRDERGIFIKKSHNHFDVCDDYEISKYYEQPSKVFKTKVEVEITNLRLDNRYYTFNYKLFVDGNLKDESYYENSHSWADDKKTFYEMLKSGLAVETVLRDIDL